jgi:hypothetical protein
MQRIFFEDDGVVAHLLHLFLEDFYDRLLTEHKKYIAQALRPHGDVFIFRILLSVYPLLLFPHRNRILCHASMGAVPLRSNNLQAQPRFSEA